ncbi:MAG: hypothetical protein QXX12_00120 [Nanopusillaceae archaeon]
MGGGERVIVIRRVGSCRACGFCCGFVDGKITEGACPHLTADGKCSIYDRRDQYCERCGRDHKDCIEGPKHPLNKLNPKCGYVFIEEETGAAVLSIELG